ncbi:MAG: saccharopine dehydrogenase NADP-binding domain-containing protein, partial [Rubrivivax sp.]|nr:saccharopine dehydrogenase NADP-binding domain-containing protein [Rubrivivax sp.]
MRITLLGAGHIGQLIARLLSTSGDYELTVLDRDAAALARLQALPLQTRVADTADAAVLLQALRGQQAVVNALPYTMAITAATAAREAGCHYFDLTEDVAATQAIRRLADGAPT